MDRIRPTASAWPSGQKWIELKRMAQMDYRPNGQK